MEEQSKYATSVPSTQISAQKDISTISNINFDEPGRNYWKQKHPECFDAYVNGDMAGKFSKNDLFLNTIFDKINTLVKNISVIALSRKGQTSEQVKDCLDLIKLNLKIISNTISNDKLSEADIRYLYSFMHGFINGTINIQKGKNNDNW